MNYLRAWWLPIFAVCVAACARTAAPPPPIVTCVDPLAGSVGSLDDAEITLRFADQPSGDVLVVRLPGAKYPDEVDPRPLVYANVVDGGELTVGTGDAKGDCGSESRSRFDVPVVLEKSVKDHDLRIRVQQYRLPLRSTPALPVEFVLRDAATKTETTIGTCSGEVRAGAPIAVRVVAPSYARLGQPIGIRIASLDRWGNASTDPGELRLEINGERPNLPPLRTDENGVATINWSPEKNGVFRFGIIRREGERELEIGRSNPIVVDDALREGTLLWGDPHSHTGYSDGFTTETPGGAYRYARDTAFLDFAAVTDHVEAIWGCAMSHDQWESLMESAETWNAPGRFVAFAGYEWTASFPFGGVKSEAEGHAHLLFPGRAVRCGSNQPECATLDGLLDFMRPHQPVVIRHHTCANWAPAVFSGRVDSQTPVVEVTSSHGNCECVSCPGRMPESSMDPKNDVRTALLSGPHYGLVGGSDNHNARPGSTNYFRKLPLILDTGGITALSARRFDREGILEALRARRTYATTGARIVVEFTAGETSMGGVLPAGAEAKGRFTVHGTNVIGAATVFRGDLDDQSIRVVTAEVPGVLDFEAEWRDPSPPARGFYYLRVEQVDGEMAWTSPIRIGPVDQGDAVVSPSS
ncbi:MAG: DUF3604 domain-containing protein [Deltaproteobacteria bacterium]|nr:DUF3604 domain-containing protein [Deltaproteobacteria bacterium]